MSIEEVVNLIEDLYSVHPSHDVNQVQLNLQSIQKSSNGYQLANELLDNRAYSPNVKYFGALTLAVQLATSTNSDEILWKLFRSNLIHLVNLCNELAENPQGKSPLMATIRKLMSNLSVIFTNINESQDTTERGMRYWNNPINTFVQLLSQRCSTSPKEWTPEMIDDAVNVSVPYDHLIKFIQSSAISNNLLLMFTEIIVEDLTKFQSKKNRMSKVYEVVHEHLYVSTMALVNSNLTILRNTDEVLYSCINAWINYISMARNVSPHGRMNLSEMFANLINLMCESREETDNFSSGEKILNILADVFANDPTLMDYELRETIEVIFIGVSRSGAADTSKHQWMLQYMNHLVTHEMTEELKELSICVVDFLQNNTLDLCNKLFTHLSDSENKLERSQQYVKVLLQMTNFPLAPILEEFFSVRMVDFWLDLADAYTNLASSSLSAYGPELATEIFQQVVSIYLPKISLLNKQKVIQSDSDETPVHEFDDFRGAVSDLMESLWSILGNDKLTNVLISSIGSSSSNNVDVFEVEAMSLLLNTLLRDMTLTESPWLCEVLDSCEYFIGNILLLLQTGYEDGEENLLQRAIKLDFVRTSSTLIGSLAGYLKQSTSYLTTCIDVLFQGLEKCTLNSNGNWDKVEILTIKTLDTLCESCRTELTSYLPQLFNVVTSLLTPGSNISSFTREKLVRSIGFIIECQVEAGPEEQAKYILQLVKMIDSFLQQTISPTTQQTQEQRDYVHSLLTCISELGSAMLPSEETENIAFVQRLGEFQDFWKRDPLQIRTKILHLLLQILNHPAYSKDSGCVEISCLILGKGLSLSDDEPYFLRYPMPEIMNFILEQTKNAEISTSLPFYAYLLENLISQYKDQLSPQEFGFIFENIFLRNYHEFIIGDPDLLQTTINFVNSVLDAKPSLAIYSTYWQSFILTEFIKLLSVREKFTIVAITKFWTKMMNNKKYTQADLSTTQQQINSIGQQLTSQAMLGLYHTQRSDLNCFTDLLRVLTAKFPMQVKSWLSVALPQICSNNAAHEKFISKLLVTRGNRAASNVILEWWLECNQLPSL